MSLIAIVNKIKKACDEHALVQECIAGYAWDRTIGTKKYPLVYIDINPGSILDKSVNHRLSLYIADRIPLDFQNGAEIESSSNMLEIFFDLRMRLRDDEVNILESITFTPFTEDENDLLAGVIVDIDIQEIDLKDRCNFPTK